MSLKIGFSRFSQEWDLNWDWEKLCGIFHKGNRKTEAYGQLQCPCTKTREIQDQGRQQAKDETVGNGWNAGHAHGIVENCPLNLELHKSILWTHSKVPPIPRRNVPEPTARQPSAVKAPFQSSQSASPKLSEKNQNISLFILKNHLPLLYAQA